MGQQTIERAGSACIIFDIREFNYAKLPEVVQSKWAPFKLRAAAERSHSIRTAAHRIYSSLEGSSSRPHSPRKLRQAHLSDMRKRAADAAASLSAAQPDPDITSSLASRLLANMEAASQRRREALEMRKARSAAKHGLLLQRLGASGAVTEEAKRRSAFLQQLRNRLAADTIEEQEAGAADSEPELNLSVLVTKHGMEDWMEGLSPKTAHKAATFRVTRSTKRLQRSWRRFASQHKPTSQLAQDFAAQGVAALPKQQEQGEDADAGAGAQADEPEMPAAGGFVMFGGVGSFKTSAKHEPFEDFAKKLQSPVTIKAAQALLRRLEQRLSAAGVTSDGAQSLLRQLSPSAPAGRRLERYPVRVMLCAYMIKEHPEVVFNSVGDIEARLSAGAHRMLDAFEALLHQLLQPTGATAAASDNATPPARTLVCPSPLTNSMTRYAAMPAEAPDSAKPSVARSLFPNPGGAFAQGSGGSSSSSGSVSSPRTPARCDSQGSSPTRSQGSVSLSPLAQQQQPQQPSLARLLVAFDDSWVEYLDQFVVWKGRDAAGLEQELMRMAVRLERSMRSKLGRREQDSPEVRNNPDLQAMISQVSHDHALLAERIARLTGPDGSARLEAALAHVRQQVAAELQAAEDAASEASWETTPEAGRSRPVSRAASRTGSMLDPMSDAEALTAAQAASQPQQGRDSTPSSPETAQQGSDEAQAKADALGNEQLVWEMLYNPDYSLPSADAVAAWHRAMGKEVEEEEVDASDVESMTPERLQALVARRARGIAERAFWDSIVWRFKTAAQGQALPSQLAPLLSELGTELSGFLTDAAEAQQLAEQYAEPAVLARLTSSNGQQGGGANLTALGAMLEQLAQALLKSGGPDRASEGADAAQQLHARMAAALAAAVAPSSDSSSPSTSPTSSPVQARRQEEAAAAAALAEGLASALRLLMTQLKVVKLDAANARLAGLARAMREQGAVRYLQTKLAAAWELPSLDNISSTAERQVATAEMSAKLSRTAAWVVDAQQGLQTSLASSLSSAGLLLDASTATAAVVAGGLQSVELRSGVRASPTASPGRSSVPRSPNGSFTASPTAAGAVKPRFPVALDSWQGTVRAGLLSLVSGTTPAAGPQTPEVLLFDRVRLHDLQNALQQLLVAAAGLLIVQQLRQAGGLPWDAEMRAQARRRLLIVLSDPGMKLAHLVTELTQLAGATGVATEDRVCTMFTTIVNPDASGFKSIRSGIISALAAHLLYGRAALAADGSAASACVTVLGRVGAAALQEDVADLGQRLAGVAAVCEAVHGDTLALLAAAGRTGGQ